MDKIDIESYRYDKGPSIKTIYKKREFSNGKGHYEVIIKNNNDKKIFFYESEDEDPYQFKRNYNNKQNSFINSYKDPNGSFNIIYSRNKPFVNKEKIIQSSSMEIVKNNNYNNHNNHNNYKKVANSSININKSYNNNQKTSPIREYTRKSPRKENNYKFTKDIIRKPIKRDKIRRSIKDDYLNQFINKGNKKISNNKSFKRKSLNKKDLGMKQLDNISYINKPKNKRAYHNSADTRYYHNNNNSAINTDYNKKTFFNNKNGQKSSAININSTKKDPLFDIGNHYQNNQKSSQVGSNFYKRNPIRRFNIDNLFTEKRNMNNNFIRKKESEKQNNNQYNNKYNNQYNNQYNNKYNNQYNNQYSNQNNNQNNHQNNNQNNNQNKNQNKNRKSSRREANNSAKRRNNANAHHSVPKYESSSPEYDNFCNEALQEHNIYRKRHHVEPLKLNKELCKIAQNYANHLANVGRLQHSDNTYHNKNIGENLYYCSGKEATGSSVTTSWYSEVKYYDYNGDYSDGTGHFAQVVWKDTKEVGFGKSKGQNGKIFVVANYYPPGNVIGYFRSNVLRP